MQKREFIDLVAARTGLTKKDSERTMNALFEVLGELLSRGDRLVVNGFGTFETKVRAARRAHDPRTGERMQLPATVVPAFKPSQLLKDQLDPNQRKKGATIQTT